MKTNRIFIFVSIICFFIFTVLGKNNLDPDFGWRYQLGKLVSQGDIPQTDPFSYTMHSYPYIDWEWISNFSIYQGYTEIGLFGLALITAIFPIAAVVIVLRSFSKREFLIPAILGYATLIRFAGVRPQMIAWVFFSLFISILTNEQQWKKQRWIIPPLIFIWANFHPSFPLAIALFAIYKCSEYLQTRKSPFQDILVFVLSIFASFINPYGTRLLEEIVHQMKYTDLYRRTLQEWFPFYTSFNLAFVCLATFTTALSFRYRNKISFGFHLIFITTLIFAASSLRHIPLFVFVALPLLARCFNLVKNDVFLVPEGKRRYQTIVQTLLGISFMTFFLNTYFSTGTQISETGFYPQGAVAYLKDHVVYGNILTNYDWGGYLIWKAPQYKTFVDGRMSGFVWNAPENESSQIYVEYLRVKAGMPGWQEILQKYKVNYVLWTPEFTGQVTPQTIMLRKIVYGFGGELYEPQVSLVTRLKTNGWIELYKDKVSILLKRP